MLFRVRTPGTTSSLEGDLQMLTGSRLGNTSGSPGPAAPAPGLAISASKPSAPAPGPAAPTAC